MSDSERDRGDLWAEVMRAWGAWVHKLSTSVFSGLPDWLLVHPSLGITLVEAKKLQESGAAFVPSQCTRAQRFFLEVVSRYGGSCYVLVLGPDSWYMQRVEGSVEALAREVFDALAKPYEVQPNVAPHGT